MKEGGKEGGRKERRERKQGGRVIERKKTFTVPKQAQNKLEDINL